MNTNIPHYYGKVFRHPLSMIVKLVGVPVKHGDSSLWTIPREQVSEFSLYDGDIVRAQVPSLDDQFCKVIEKVVYE
jgi:hypothetical protein